MQQLHHPVIEASLVPNSFPSATLCIQSSLSPPAPHFSPGPHLSAGTRQWPPHRSPILQARPFQTTIQIMAIPLCSSDQVTPSSKESPGHLADPTRPSSPHPCPPLQIHLSPLQCSSPSSRCPFLAPPPEYHVIYHLSPFAHPSFPLTDLSSFWDWLWCYSFRKWTQSP